MVSPVNRGITPVNSRVELNSTNMTEEAKEALRIRESNGDALEGLKEEVLRF